MPNALFVGEVNGSYGDPEFSESASQVVFQDSQNRVWIGDIDRETGLFRSPTGRDYLMDENITIIFDRPPQGRKFSTNGPEWTKDSQGHFVVYTKLDRAGRMQQWMARLIDGRPEARQLTDQPMDCYGNMPSRFDDGKPPRIAFTYNWPIWYAKAAWVYADRPEELHQVPGFDYNKMSMWSAVSSDFLFVHRPAGAPRGQIARANADTGTIQVLTNDEGEKDDPGLFLAPEFGGEMLLVANVDNSALGIYRDLKSPDGFWTRVATLQLPEDAPYKFISSPETIAPATGVGGVSYFALLARESKDRNSPGGIWVLGLGADPENRFVRRVDDGAVTDAAAVLEPEPFVGTNEVYVYYNYYKLDGTERGLRRASTGILVRDEVVEPWLTKPSLEVCLTASDASRATQFFVDGIGLAARPEPATGVPGMRMLLFSAGPSTIKVRVYAQKPKPLPTELAARNGLRVVTIPIERFDETVARLQQLGFEASEPREDRGTRWTLARDGDGTAFELVEAEAGIPRELELGLVVPDLSLARDFFTRIYRARELPEEASRVLQGNRELRFAAGATLFNVWSPAGQRPSDQDRIQDVLGFRYVTHYVRDTQALHDSYVASRIEIAAPLASFGSTASIFMARGPGGILLEFVGPALGSSPGAFFPAFTFETDYHAGRQARGTSLAAATEANALEIHDGKIYAVTSYMPESGRLADLNPKVLVKKSADGAWEIDFEAGQEFMRLGSLKSVRFTTDGAGNKLDPPVSVLVAGTGAWRSQNPTGVVVFSRNDQAGQWVRSILSTDIWNRDRLNHATEVRCIFDHVDRVTGVHSVFAGSQTGRLFRGVYDPAEPGLIRWDPTPEIDDLLGNFLSAAEVNGVQYVGVAYGPTDQGRLPSDRPVEDHGLFRRIDGPGARWEWVRVREWEDPERPGRSLRTGQLRGLTAIPAPEGEGEVLLLAWDTVDAVIERVNPREDHKVTIELNVRDYLTRAMNRKINLSSFAYNDMVPMLNPATGNDVHLIGLWVVDPAGEVNETAKSSWYLARHTAGKYTYGRIWDPRNPLTGSRYGLRGCRSIRPSPFPEEAGRVWYFAGFDQTGTVGACGTGPTAWIYRGRLQELP